MQTFNNPWQHGKSVFWGLWWFTLALKMWLAVFFPITSDEAFFNVWAWFPQWGYYDHPPMVGWWLWIMNQFGHAPWVLRLPTVLMSGVVALMVVRLVEQPSKAWWAGSVYLSLPVSWFGVFITTDTPLIYALTAALYAYTRAWQIDRSATTQTQKTWQQFLCAWPALWRMALAGMFLGLAFLSKYFAVLMGLAFALHLLWQRRWLWVLALGSMALPWVSINLIYNAHHCWNNVMFNLINRHDDASLGWQNLLLYLTTLTYVLGPWVVWHLFKARGQLGTLPKATVAVLVAVAVPLGIFLILSLEKTIGLHWLLGFVPGTMVLLAYTTQTNTLRHCVLYNLLWGVPHVVLFALLLHGPSNLWGQGSFAKSVTFHRQLPQLLHTLNKNLPVDTVLASTAYSPAALMSYHLSKVVPVFGPGKYHARNDDVFVDWRTMQGKTFRIVAKEQDIAPELYQGILSNVQVQNITIEGIQFTVVDGDNFNYAAFRERHLALAALRYYRIPTWLPIFGCDFTQRYEF